MRLFPSLALVLAMTLCGCSAAISSMAVAEAQLAARVKTALINDPEVGTRPIEVSVRAGFVRLVGRVDSAAQAERARQLASAVEGVAAVVSDLQVVAVPTPMPPQPVQGGEVAPPRRWTEPDDEPDTGPHLLAVGLSLRRSMPGDRALADALTLGPLVRFGSGRGFGPAIGFGWYGADWRAGSDDALPLARVRIKPVLGGVSYGIARGDTILSFSLVGGPSFNSVDLSDVLPAGEVPLDVETSMAIRPGASLWFDVGRRLAVNIGGSYLLTRPRLRLLGTDGMAHNRTMRGDAVLVSAGVAYKLF